MNKTLRQSLQELGGDLWVMELGGERRMKLNESWEGFKRDLLIWFNSEEFTDSKIPEALEVIKKLPPIESIRISGCSITLQGVETIKHKLPGISVNYVQNS